MLLVTTALLSGAHVAAAHAVLLGQFPRPGASLAAAPAEVRLRFDEVVTPVVIRILNARGSVIRVPDAVSEVNTTLHLRLPGHLASGTYVVTYRVISADSHPVGGSFVFAIGGGAPDARLASRVAGSEVLERWSAVLTGLRFAFYAAFLLAAGTGLFLALVDDSPVESAFRTRQIDRRITLAGIAVAAVTAVLSLWVEGAAAAGVTLRHIADLAVWRIGLESTLGRSAAVMACGLTFLAAGFLARRPLASALWVSGALLGALSFALTGHVATASPRVLTTLALIVHVLAAAFWLGALLPLGSRLVREPAPAARRIVRRFSRLAVFAVAMLIIAGSVMAVVQVRTPAALIDTPYGRRLGVKLLLVAGMLTLAALNMLKLTPALEAGDPRAAPRLGGTLRAELVLGAAILLATAMLGEVVPPRALAEGAALAAQAPGTSGRVTRMAMSGGQMATFEVEPARPGENRIAVTLTNADESVMTPQAVSVWISSRALGIEAQRYQAVRLRAGRYLITAPLPIAGTWTIEIDALITDFKEAVFTAEVPVR
jgi:copper transport protein